MVKFFQSVGALKKTMPTISPASSSRPGRNFLLKCDTGLMSYCWKRRIKKSGKIKMVSAGLQDGLADFPARVQEI